jgi:hypothetical protein
MIVLSSDDAVADVLVKKSGNYSDRPDMFIGQKIASGNLRLVVMVSASIAWTDDILTFNDIEVWQ